MKAITVQQPWAWAILFGGKNIENRSNLWTYRGPLVIHAGLRWSPPRPSTWRVQRAWAEQYGDLELAAVQLTAGAVLGWVDLVDVHLAQGCCAPWGEQPSADGRVTHLVLDNPHPLAAPIPYRGARGLWPVPPDLSAALAAA